MPSLILDITYRSHLQQVTRRVNCHCKPARLMIVSPPMSRCTIMVTALLPLLLNAFTCQNAVADPQMLSLSGVALHYGMVPTVMPTGEWLLRSHTVCLKFEPESRRLVFNGILIWMHDAASQREGRLNISRIDAVSILDPLFRPDRVFVLSQPPTAVLDPGHGGADSGAVGSFTCEKNLTVAIASLVETELSSSGIQVFLTRTNDVSLSLKDRADFARNHKADVFISIHANWAENSNASGLETFLFPASSSSANSESSSGPAFDAANMILAYEIHRLILSETFAEDRGIKRARFDVLRNATCPAILVECGFLSNRAEENALADESYKRKIARGIAAGILSFLSNAGLLR